MEASEAKRKELLDQVFLFFVSVLLPAVEPEGNNVRGCKDFELKAKARIWP